MPNFDLNDEMTKAVEEIQTKIKGQFPHDIEARLSIFMVAYIMTGLEAGESLDAIKLMFAETIKVMQDAFGFIQPLTDSKQTIKN